MVFGFLSLYHGMGTGGCRGNVLDPVAFFAFCRLLSRLRIVGWKGFCMIIYLRERGCVGGMERRLLRRYFAIEDYFSDFVLSYVGPLFHTSLYLSCDLSPRKHICIPDIP